MNESIPLIKALKKFQVIEDGASSSNEAVEHSPSDGSLLKHFKTVTINEGKARLHGNQLNLFLALVSVKTAEDE